MQDYDYSQYTQHSTAEYYPRYDTSKDKMNLQHDINYDTMRYRNAETNNLIWHSLFSFFDDANNGTTK